MKQKEKMLIIVEGGNIQIIYSTIDLDISYLDNDVFAIGDGDFDDPIQQFNSEFEVVTPKKFNKILNSEKKRIKEQEEL